MSIFIIVNGLLFLFVVAVGIYIEVDKRKIKKEMLLANEQNQTNKTNQHTLEQNNTTK